MVLKIYKYQTDDRCVFPLVLLVSDLDQVKVKILNADFQIRQTFATRRLSQFNLPTHDLIHFVWDKADLLRTFRHICAHRRQNLINI